MPDYYKDFKCKCGECRHVCCVGWNISVSEEEYFRLIGINCKKHLRNKLDSSFVIADEPERNNFAFIAPGYTGECPMLDTDGYCMLHKECGEVALPLVCRVYPRSVRQYGSKYEISASNSCEETVELLMRDDETIKFETADIALPFDGIKIYDGDDDKDSVRMNCISIMQNRSKNLRERIKEIGGALCRGEDVAESSPDVALSVIINFIRVLENHSRSINEYGSRALEYIGRYSSGGAFDEYKRAEEHLYNLFPDIRIYVEKIIINHMLYESFPYVPGSESVDCAYASLCFAIALMKFICVINMADSTDNTKFVDVTAEVFRYIEHSSFYSIEHASDKQVGLQTYADVAAMFD